MAISFSVLVLRKLLVGGFREYSENSNEAVSIELLKHMYIIEIRGDITRDNFWKLWKVILLSHLCK